MYVWGGLRDLLGPSRALQPHLWTLKTPLALQSLLRVLQTPSLTIRSLSWPDIPILGPSTPLCWPSIKLLHKTPRAIQTPIWALSDPYLGPIWAL